MAWRSQPHCSYLIERCAQFDPLDFDLGAQCERATNYLRPNLLAVRRLERHLGLRQRECALQLCVSWLVRLRLARSRRYT